MRLPMIVGYARTSTTDQSAGLAAQERDLTAMGAERLYSEQVSSLGQRAKLAECLAYLRDGDVLAVDVGADLRHVDVAARREREDHRRDFGEDLTTEGEDCEKLVHSTTFSAATGATMREGSATIAGAATTCGTTLAAFVTATASIDCVTGVPGNRPGGSSPIGTCFATSHPYTPRISAASNPVSGNDQMIHQFIAHGTATAPGVPAARRSQHWRAESWSRCCSG